MTYEFEYLIHLVGCGAQGLTPAKPTQPMDWHKLYRLAGEQTVSTLLAYVLKRNAALECPIDLREGAATSMRGAVVGNYMRREGIMKLLKVFEDEGIHAVLLKGFAVAREYDAPECRISADTDIWVKPADEERACDLLRRNGFTVNPRWKNGHHAVCHHPQLGCVELHVILYDEIVEDVWFNKMNGNEFIREPHEKVTGDSGEYYTLGKTDQLIFLTLHMVKHFIISGMSLRMMLDTALFMKHHAHEIDMDRYWNILRSLKFDTCVNSILWAMVLYAGFKSTDFIGMSVSGPPNIDELLNDLEAGGCMGINDKKNREDGWNEYNRQKLMQNRSNAAYKWYMIKWQSSEYLKSLFPNKKALVKHYSYVNEKPWLIPYAWLHRLIFRGFRVIKKGHVLGSHIVMDAEKLSDSGKERIKMFKRLGMI